jgi:hypothetical protein
MSALLHLFSVFTFHFSHFIVHTSQLTFQISLLTFHFSHFSSFSRVMFHTSHFTFHFMFHTSQLTFYISIFIFHVPHFKFHITLFTHLISCFAFHLPNSTFHVSHFTHHIPHCTFHILILLSFNLNSLLPNSFMQARAPSPLLARLHHLDLSGQTSLLEEAVTNLLKRCHTCLQSLALADTQAAAATFEMLLCTANRSNNSSRGMGGSRATNAAAAGRGSELQGRPPLGSASSSSSSRLQQIRSKGFPQLQVLDVCGCAALQSSNAAVAAFKAFRDALIGLPQLKGAH